MTTQTMTVREFLNKSDAAPTQKEMDHYRMLSLTIKATLIASTALIPLHLSEILQLTNGGLHETVNAYVNQFTPGNLIDVMRIGGK